MLVLNFRMKSSECGGQIYIFNAPPPTRDSSAHSSQSSINISFLEKPAATRVFNGILLSV